MVSQKEAEMFAKVAQWKESSMSVVAFARTFGITERKFYYWVQKERETFISGVDDPGFIEIGQLIKPVQPVKPTALREVEIQPVKFISPQIELIFPSGLCVKIYA